MTWTKEDQAAFKKEQNRLRMARNYRHWAEQNLDRKRQLAREWARKRFGWHPRHAARKAISHSGSLWAGSGDSWDV